MGNHFDLTDEQFMVAFENCSLSPKLFNHEAHLRLAWIHIRNSGLDAAIEVVSSQIMAYVQHVGGQDKYNHTLTVAAVQIVHHFLQKSDYELFSDFIRAFPRLKTDFKGLVQSHYSTDIFTSIEAKRIYLKPDLIPFQ